MNHPCKAPESSDDLQIPSHRFDLSLIGWMCMRLHILLVLIQNRWLINRIGESSKQSNPFVYAIRTADFIWLDMDTNVQRASCTNILTKLIPRATVYRASVLGHSSFSPLSTMIIGHWDTRSRGRLNEFQIKNDCVISGARYSNGKTIINPFELFELGSLWSGSWGAMLVIQWNHRI